MTSDLRTKYCKINLQNEKRFVYKSLLLTNLQFLSFFQINGSTCSSSEDPSETISQAGDQQNLIPPEKSEKPDKPDKNVNRIIYEMPADSADTHSAFDNATFYV
jgi:hypothetical protein